MPRRSTASLAAATMLAALLIALPLWRGGVGPQAELAACLATLLAAALAARDDARLPGPVLVLLAPFAVSLLQLVPLPGGRVLSLDPPATGRGLATLALGWSGLAAAWQLGHGRRRRERVVLGLAGSGLAVALSALGLAAIGAEPLLAPSRPFANPNQQGGYAALTAPILLGLALQARGARRLLWLLAFAPVAALPALALSRGAMGAALGGLGLFALLALRRRPIGGEPPRRTALVLMGGLALGLGIAAFLALGPALAEWRGLRILDDSEKTALWRPAWQLLGDHPLFGIGRGAFATAFAAYKTGAERVTYTHVENDWLQPLLDFGAPIGLLTVATLAWLWLRVARRRDLDWTELGLLAGTAALAAQAAFDFALERPASSLAFSVALGLLQRNGRSDHAAPAWLPRAPPATPVGIVLGAAALAGMALWWAHPLDGDAARVAAASSPTEAEALARRLDRWHPADWLPPALVGGRWVEAGRCAPAMAWLVEAMRRDPTAPEPHLYTARCLASAGQPAAARREYRLARAFGRTDALAEAARRWPTAEALAYVAPATGEGLLEVAAELRRAGLEEEAGTAWRRALEEYGETRALAPLSAAALAAGDPAGALDLALRLQASAPREPEGWRAATAALRALGREEEAEATLLSGLERFPGAVGLVTAQVERALALRRFAEARRAAEALPAGTPALLARRESLVATSLAVQGRLIEAIEHLRLAAEAVPAETWPLESLATAYAAAGRYGEAEAAIEHAASRPGQDPAAWAARLEALRKQRDEATTRRRTEALLRER